MNDTSRDPIHKHLHPHNNAFLKLIPQKLNIATLVNPFKTTSPSRIFSEYPFLRQATGAITSGYRCRSLIRLLSTIYGCSIYSCCSALYSVFILWLLMDMPAFCVFKQFSARVGLFRLCACSSISIHPCKLVGDTPGS